MTANRWRPAVPAAVLCSAALLLAACTGGTGSLRVDEPWARTSPTMATAGAAYMVIVNDGEADDALLGASVASSVAARVEVHETVATGSGGMGASPGMMEMRPVDRIDMPAGESVSLEPGGYHIMLLDLAEPLEDGDTFELTLRFEQAGEMELTVDVRENGS
jgi:copper(I)-binding protein